MGYRATKIGKKTAKCGLGRKMGECPSREECTRPIVFAPYPTRACSHATEKLHEGSVTASILYLLE